MTVADLLLTGAVAIQSPMSIRGLWKASQSQDATTATVNGNTRPMAGQTDFGQWRVRYQRFLLRATDRIRFVPNQINGAAPWLDVRAWDQTSGSAGTKVDASTTGGITAFSTATERVSLTVTSVNDSPAVGTNIGANVTEGGTVTITTAMLNEADVDDAGTGLTYTATTVPANGQLEFASAPGVAITTFTQG